MESFASVVLLLSLILGVFFWSCDSFSSNEGMLS